MQSNIVDEGFPVQMGLRLSAYRNEAMRDPPPGRMPDALGYVLSSFVAMKVQVGLVYRYRKALDNLV